MLNFLADGRIVRARLVHDVNAGDLVVSAQGEVQGVAETDGVTDDVIAVVFQGVVYLPTLDAFDTDFQQVYIRATDLKVVSSPLPVLTAPDVSASAQSGGSLSDGDYYYALTVTDLNGGETVIGTVDSDTVSGVDKSIELTWAAVDNAITYEIYRGIAADELKHLTSVAAPMLTYLDDGSVAIGISSPPDYNTTGTLSIGRYLSGYEGSIRVASSLITYPTGSRDFEEYSEEQKWIPAGNIPVLLQL